MAAPLVGWLALWPGTAPKTTVMITKENSQDTVTPSDIINKQNGKEAWQRHVNEAHGFSDYDLTCVNTAARACARKPGDAITKNLATVGIVESLSLPGPSSQAVFLISPSSVGDRCNSVERAARRRPRSRARRGGPAQADRPESQSEAEDGQRGPEELERDRAEVNHLPLLSAPPLLLRQEGANESAASTPSLSSSPSPQTPRTSSATVCGYGYYGNDPADLVKHFRKYHLGLHNRTRQDAALDTHILALHNMAPQQTSLGNSRLARSSTQGHTQAGHGPRNQAKELGKARADAHGQHKTVMANGTYDVQVTVGGTLIGIGRKTSDCQGNTKYFRCKFCNFTYMGSNSLDLEQHFLSSHPNKVKTPPTTPLLANNSLALQDNVAKERSQAPDGAERNCREGRGRLSGTDASNCDAEAVVTSYNCQLCDFRYSMAHSANVIVVAPLLLHYQHNHSIHRCCIQHCMYCPQGLCQPQKHLGEVSHPFACQKPTCPKCCTKFPQSSTQQETAGSNPVAATSPSMTPPNLRGDAAVTPHPSNPGHPVVTQDVTHLCDQCTFATTDIDVLLRHYESCHALISLKGRRHRSKPRTRLEEKRKRPGELKGSTPAQSATLSQK
ncbi:unnamed protein product [Tetraodon nigroviridis]|uniref:(spotted green pufferfish) hypothetical protein n=1 Tax=Tetraodon nigroviridis TaxID=99883 RepID=Q4SIY9_TETNG|nr:unnamed protein product [Tetraodon nigroviridis]